MTSPTDKTYNRRRAKKAKNGRKQKNKIRKLGTTPELFALNKNNLSPKTKETY